jgi:hypothetical protein
VVEEVKSRFIKPAIVGFGALSNAWLVSMHKKLKNYDCI